MKISTATEAKLTPHALEAPARKTPAKRASAVQANEPEVRAERGRRAVETQRISTGDAHATTKGARLDRSPQMVARAWAPAKTEPVATSKAPSARTVTMQKEAQLVLDALHAKDRAGDYFELIPQDIRFGNARGRHAVLCALAVAEQASKEAGITGSEVVARYVNWGGAWRADGVTQYMTRDLKAYLKTDERATIARGRSASEVLQLSPAQRLKEAQAMVPAGFVRITPELVEKELRERFGPSGPKDGASFELAGQQVTVRYDEAPPPQEPDYRRIRREGGDVQAAHSSWIGVGGGLQALYSGEKCGALTIDLKSADGKYSRFSGYASYYQGPRETYGRGDQFYTENVKEWTYGITKQDY